jgi:hypothetical protein
LTKILPRFSFAEKLLPAIDNYVFQGKLGDHQDVVKKLQRIPTRHKRRYYEKWLPECIGAPNGFNMPALKDLKISEDEVNNASYKKLREDSSR